MPLQSRVLASILLFGLGACRPVGEDAGPSACGLPAQAGAPEVARVGTPATLRPGERLSLFDGETLEGWRVTEKDDFSSRGEVRVREGFIVLGEGDPYTGVGWTGEFPKEDFEITAEATRLSGYDIFCGLTVPVGEGHVTLVLGGWGDCVVGLSNVDYENASENETTTVMSFKNDQWYSVRLRVTSAGIQAWIDGEQVVDLAREGRTFTIYDQLEPQKPMGFFSWQTGAAVRGIEMRRLGP